MLGIRNSDAGVIVVPTAAAGKHAAWIGNCHVCGGPMILTPHGCRCLSSHGFLWRIAVAPNRFDFPEAEPVPDEEIGGRKFRGRIQVKGRQSLYRRVPQSQWHDQHEQKPRWQMVRLLTYNSESDKTSERYVMTEPYEDLFKRKQDARSERKRGKPKRFAYTTRWRR